MDVTRFLRLKHLLKKNQIDSLLVSNFYNILYLTSFKTLTTDEREAFALVTKDNLYLFSDARYINKNFQFSIFNSQLKIKVIGHDRGLTSHLQEIIRDEKIESLGFEAEDLRYYEYLNLKTSLSQTTLTPTLNLIIKEREIKDTEEIKKIEKACLLTSDCLKAVIKTIKSGDTEKDLAYRMENWIKTNGYDLAFDPIVAFDKNSALAHYNTKTGDGRLTDKSIILIDFGIKYQDYFSDITRMIFFGPPGNTVINIYNQLLGVQRKTVLQISQTKNPREIDDFCRRQLKQSGLPDYSHSTGHGVGLEIHEYPKLSQTSQDQILDNQTVTVEPGVYFEDNYGIRIEDTILISNGQAKVLTPFTKEALIL